MVHHEHDAGVGFDLRERHVVGIAQSHAIQELRRPVRQAICDPEVGIGVERRHDLAGIALDLAHQVVARLSRFPGAGGQRFLHAGVVRQPVDQHPPLRAVKRRNAELKAGIELVDHAVDPAADQAADARHQDPVEHGPHRQRGQGGRQPHRNRDCFGHSFSGYSRTRQPAFGTGPARPDRTLADTGPGLSLEVNIVPLGTSSTV